MGNRLRGISFGPTWGASGVQGWFGEGYRHHRLLGPFGPDFADVTFVAKTTTLLERAGNMPLRADWTPKQMFPTCIAVNPWAGAVLNAVGLSGPGLAPLLASGRWQARRGPFFLSFMSVAGTMAERIAEAEGFVRLMAPALASFEGHVGLQVNFSCPNVGLNPSALVDEVGETLTILASLGIPLVPKFNLTLPIDAALKISENPNCDALCVSNTIPYGKLEHVIDWKRLFGPKSPLEAIGGGGLSGAPLFPLLAAWVDVAKRNGLHKPLNAGGGIMQPRDVDFLVDNGLDLKQDSIFLGTVAIVRPWRCGPIVRRARGLCEVLPYEAIHHTRD